MANEGDQAHEAEELFRQHALEAAKRETGNEMLTGFCQNTGCGERTAGAFCSAECRRDANAMARMK